MFVIEKYILNQTLGTKSPYYFDAMNESEIIDFLDNNLECLCEQYISEGILPPKLQDRVRKGMRSIEDVHRKIDSATSNNPEYLKRKKRIVLYSKNMGKELRSAYQDKDGKKATSIIKKYMPKIKEQIVEVIRLDNGSLWEAFGLMIIMSLFYSIVTNAFALIVGPAIAIPVTIILLAPLIEETAKFIAVKRDVTGKFLLIFNIAEFGKYVVGFFSVGVPLWKAISIRSFAVFMHYINTLVQKMGVEKDKGKLGFAFGVAIHMIFNLISYLNQSKIQGWALAGSKSKSFL